MEAVGAGLPGDAGDAGPRARILIADDNADLRDYLERLLARHWEVETAADGQQALEAIRARRPDLVLSDAMMPGLDGFGLLAALRSNPSTAQLPLIMLSARAGEEAAVEGLSAGADDYLIKPFSSRELIARVRANLDLAELRQAAARATERHAQLLRDLADAAVAVNRAGSVEDILQVVAERARALVGAAWARVLLDGPDGPERQAGTAGSGDLERRVALTGSGGRVLGALLLAGDAGRGGVEAEAVLTQLAQVASTRLENALLYEREHHVAVTLQRSLLPETLPQLEGADLAALYLPGSTEASVGGDWYDAFALGDATVALVIGDVVGRGVKAASAMGQLRDAMRAYLLEGYGPADALSRVNRLLLTLGGGFATIACALVDLRTGELRYAKAGHPPPLVVGPDGSTRFLDAGLAPPIGSLRRRGLPRRRGPARSGRRARALHRRARRAPGGADRRRLRPPRRGSRRCAGQRVDARRPGRRRHAGQRSPRRRRRARLRAPRARRRAARRPAARGADVPEAVARAPAHVAVRGGPLRRRLRGSAARRGRGGVERDRARGVAGSARDRPSCHVVRRRRHHRDPRPRPLGRPAVGPQPRARPRDHAGGRRRGRRRAHPRRHDRDHPPKARGARALIQLEIDTDQLPAALVARPVGDIDMAVTPEIGDGVLEAVRSHEPACVVFDLSRVTYMDSSGIHMLFRLHNELASARAELIVVAPPGSNAARLIELVALSDAGPVRPSVESALDTCAGRAQE